MFKIKDHIYYVGKTDWELRKFHGEELSTHNGSTYNSYLIRDEKTVLIDTVWEPYAEEFVANLKRIIDLKEIDYIISLHGEVDHSGALKALLREIPGTPVYCSDNGVKSLRGQYHQDWNFVPVKTGDTLNIGKRTFTFVEARMLHWPDSLFAYLSDDNILFSNDAFGQHFCSETLFNDTVDQCTLYGEAIKYYANILSPFSNLVDRKIDELTKLNLPIDMIATSHGSIWRDDPMQIVKAYKAWANGYSENQITIVYDSMWDNTKKMAEYLAEGIREVDQDVTIKLFSAARSDKNDVITEIFKSKAVFVGCSTVNNGILSGIAGLLEEVKHLKLKGKKAFAFGSYGWSGEGPKILEGLMEGAGFEIIGDSTRALWTPDEDVRASLITKAKELYSKI